jgi:hypothetical protein
MIQKQRFFLNDKMLWLFFGPKFRPYAFDQFALVLFMFYWKLLINTPKKLL